MQWKDISPEQLMDSKLKCVFELPAEGQTNAAPQENNVDATIEEKVKRDVKSSPKVSLQLLCSERAERLCCVIGRIRTHSVTSRNGTTESSSGSESSA